MAIPIAGKAVPRIVGTVLWVDTVWWLGTSALDLGLNYLGIPEEKQRIPFLADLPIIGGLFDLSDSTGSSAVDLILTPVFEGVFELLGLSDEKEELVQALWGIILSAATNPVVAPFIIAILDFYIDDVGIDFNIDMTFFTLSTTQLEVDFWQLLKPEPIDVLVLWTYAIVGKILFKQWVVPAWNVFTSSSPS